MTKNKTIIISSLIILGMAAALANADNEKAAGSDAKVSWEVPDWLKRTNIAADVSSDEKFSYFMETIQPLLGTQDKEIVWFNQSRVSARNDRPTYNIGLGARKIFEEGYFLGGNIFYDYQDLHKHSRGGTGLEIISDKGFEGRLNGYFAISREHQVNEDTSNSYYETIADGLDWELGYPLPHLPFLKMYGGGYWYNFGEFKDKYGWQTRMEYDPVKYSRIVFKMFDDTKRSKIGYGFEGALTLDFTSFRLRDILNDLKGSKEMYPKIDLRDKVLDRVVRDFDITVKKSTKSRTTGLTIEGGRT